MAPPRPPPPVFCLFVPLPKPEILAKKKIKECWESLHRNWKYFSLTVEEWSIDIFNFALEQRKRRYGPKATLKGQFGILKRTRPAILATKLLNSIYSGLRSIQAWKKGESRDRIDAPAVFSFFFLLQVFQLKLLPLFTFFYFLSEKVLSHSKRSWVLNSKFAR